MIERTYIVPLRKGFHETAEYKKTKKAVTTLKEFLKRHMKSEKILIGKHLNTFLWKHGIKNPPHKVKITVTKDDAGLVKAELHGFTYAHQTKEERQKTEKQAEKKSKKEDKNEEKKDAAETTVEKTSDAESTEAKKPVKKAPAKKPAAKTE